LDEVIKNCDALLEAWYPGTMGGKAVAALLTGIENPSGKLSQTFPRHAGQIPIVYNARRTFYTVHHADIPQGALFPFGFGLSYTTYSYSNLKVDKTSFTADDVLTVSVDVTNTGKVAGKESVLLYSKDLVASSTPDNIRLRNFEKIELNPGETKTVTMQLKGSDLAFVGYDGKWRLEKGDFTIKCGGQTLDINCTETKVWDTPNR
jgi:beta-glucosidase